MELKESSDGAKGTLRLRLAVGVRLSVLRLRVTAPDGAAADHQVTTRPHHHASLWVLLPP